MGNKDLRLAENVYKLVFYNISFSWLLPLDGFQFIFSLCESENDLRTGKSYIQRNLDLTNLYITNDFLQPDQNYSKMYGTEHLFNEILVITNTTHKRKRKIYLDITNKCQHVIKDE